MWLSVVLAILLLGSFLGRRVRAWRHGRLSMVWAYGTLVLLTAAVVLSLAQVLGIGKQ